MFYRNRIAQLINQQRVECQQNIQKEKKTFKYLTNNGHAFTKY